jgi:hypothetical protein
MYPHAAIGLTMFFICLRKGNWKLFWQNILVHFMAVFAVVILYLPTLLSSHIHDLLNVGIRQKFEADFLWLSLSYNAWFVFGQENAFILLIIFVIFILSEFAGKKDFKVLSWFVICCFFALMLFSFIQSMPLAGHIAIFFSVGIAIMLAIIFRHTSVSSLLSRVVFVLFLAAIAIFNSYTAHHHHWFNWSNEYDRSAEKVAAKMIKNNIQSCYLTVNYYKPHLEYFYKIKGQKLAVSMPDTMSQDYQPFEPANEQSVIVRNTRSSFLDLSQYEIFYKDETITAFVRRDVNP